MTFVRVKGPDGSEYTRHERAVKSSEQVINKDAVDGNGRPLAPKQNIHKGGSLKAATDKKDG